MYSGGALQYTLNCIKDSKILLKVEPLKMARAIVKIYCKALVIRAKNCEMSITSNEN
jgi:hypothetical protein